MIDFGPIPSISIQQSAIDSILKSNGDILLFKHYWWLTGKHVPPRHNMQTNEQYIHRNWFRLKRAAREWKVREPDIVLDNGGQIK